MVNRIYKWCINCKLDRKDDGECMRCLRLTIDKSMNVPNVPKPYSFESTSLED